MATDVQTPHHVTTLDEYPSALYNAAPLHVMWDLYTAADAGGTTNGARTIEFPRLLPGKVVIFPELSMLVSDDMDASADLHIGHRAYVDSNGDTQAEDDNEWLDNVDSGGGAINATWADVTGYTSIGARVYDAQDGLRIFVTIDTADINANDTILLVVVYAHIQ